MDRTKTQNNNFSFEAIPLMFHSQTSDFFTYLEKDGLQFLEFWWNYVGDQLLEEKLQPFEGMQFETVKVPDDKTKIVVITLPQPQIEGDAIFLGLISKPEKRFAWVRLPTTDIVALVRRSDFPQGTQLAQLTPRAQIVARGAGPAPDLAAFTKIVIKMAEKVGPPNS